jgi:hypothetical protein
VATSANVSSSPSTLQATAPCGRHAVISASASSKRKEGSRAAGGRASRVPNEASVLYLCAELAKECNGSIDQFERSKPQLFASALDAVRTLEECTLAGFQASTLRKQMIGRWELILTDSPAIVKNRGSITGMPLPGTQCVGIEVVLDQWGNAETIDNLVVFGGIFNMRNVLRGTWVLTGKGGRTLEHTYAELVIAGQKLRSDSKAVLITSHVGPTVRVGRSASGNVFVFRRVLRADNSLKVERQDVD